MPYRPPGFDFGETDYPYPPPSRRNPGDWIDTEPWFDPGTGGSTTTTTTGGTKKKLTLEEIWAQDPMLQAILGRYASESDADRISRNNAIKRAIISFGYLPQGILEGLGIRSQAELDAILDPTTRELVEKSTSSGLSTWARLKDAAEQAQKNMLDTVGSRGAFRSGETGYGLKRTTLAADQARADSITQITDYLAGVQQAFTAAERARLDAADAARRASLGEYVPPEEEGGDSGNVNPAVTLPKLPTGEGQFKDYYEGLIGEGYATPYTPGNPVPSRDLHPGRTEGTQRVPSFVIPKSKPPKKKRNYRLEAGRM